MAEQIPYGVAVSIINRLASLAFREVARIYGVKAEMEKLKSTLESIQVVLADAEERQDQQDRVVQHWIGRFKEVLHKADDLLDDLVIEDLRRKVDGSGHSKVVSEVRDFFSSSNQVAFRHKMARKVEKIRQQFNDVAEDMSKLKLNQGRVIFKQNESAWRETSSFVLQSDIIGREESIKEIIDLLKQTHNNQNVSLIAIVGIGGLGKTALAQLVFKYAEEKKLFDKQMWVCISEDFEVKTVLSKMLKSLNVSVDGDLELDQLQNKLREKLNGQKYMLVFDDVWNESSLKWNAVRTYLMCGGQGSKILVTTRSEIVAQTMGVNTPYALKGLTKEQSWALLKNLAFGEDARRMSPNFVSIGERIAEKCSGVPLAIRTMGGMLQSKIEESEWLSVLDGDFWRQCQERDSIMPVLKLSYQNLPLELRQCFAYCSLYPKDWIINKRELIQLWMAQGYLECSIETQSMEDVGNQYVKTLLMRSFFQDASMNEFNEIIGFKMHDLMHDLAMSVGGNDCYSDNERKGIVGSPIHVSFVSEAICSLDSLDASKLRTVICDGAAVGFMTKPFVTNLKYLRVLNLKSSSIVELPESIGKFKHLRYLDLSYCYELISLPKSIGNLVSLQTLKLHQCMELVFSVEVITKLISLRHLDVTGCKAFEDMMPIGLGKLTSLQYLPIFTVGDDEKRKCGNLNELKHLNNIRDDLTIRNLGLVKDAASKSQEANLKAKKYIQELTLFWGDHLNENKISDSLQLLDNLCPHQNLRELIVSGYPGVRFSNWVSSLTNIVTISFFDFPNCECLPSFGRLPWLKALHIRRMNELKHIHCECLVETSDRLFPCLERLSLNRCPNLKGWKRLVDVDNGDDVDEHLSPPSFPCLSYLQILDCPNLTCMPSYFLSGVKRLEIGKIDIKAMPKDCMQNLASLKCLSIRGLPSIAPVLRHMQQLPVELEELEICKVDRLDQWEDDEDFSTGCRAPHGLRSLRKITIDTCENLKALPEWICSLQSLTHITISVCPSLELLPEGMRRLTNLQALQISHCPLLSDRYQIQTCADWPGDCSHSRHNCALILQKVQLNGEINSVSANLPIT